MFDYQRVSHGWSNPSRLIEFLEILWFRSFQHTQRHVAKAAFQQVPAQGATGHHFCLLLPWDFTIFTMKNVIWTIKHVALRCLKNGEPSWSQHVLKPSKANHKPSTLGVQSDECLMSVTQRSHLRLRWDTMQSVAIGPQAISARRNDPLVGGWWYTYPFKED